MLFIIKREGVLQNLGWLDRAVRVIVGGVLLVVPMMILTEAQEILSWQTLSMLIAVYPLLTGIIGIDPIYSGLNLRTCDTSRRNQCGTFPYELDAALGHNPLPVSDIDHSLEHSRHSSR